MPQPIHDGLELQRKKGLVNYRSHNAHMNGLALYSLFVGKPHRITDYFANLSEDDQDLVHDFAFSLVEEDISLKGQFFERLITDIKNDNPTADSDQLSKLTGPRILELAQQWQNSKANA